MVKFLFLFFFLTSCSTFENPPLPTTPAKANSVLFPVGSKYDSVLKGKLKNQGANFEKSAAKYNLPVDIVIAICWWESSPKSNSKLIQRYNNVSGSMYKGKPMKFATVAESIDYTCKNLSLNYYRKGRKTLPAIQKKYAPYNSEWSAGVKKMMAKLP